MKTDVLVIGGSAAGLVAATTAKSNHPDKKVTLVRKEEKVMIPCGIPYIFSTVGTSEKNILPDAGLNQLGVEIKFGEVTDVDTDKKIAKVKNGEEIEYDKLILGTGSRPVVPGWLKGTELANVFTIPKDKLYLDDTKEKLKNLKKIVIVGAGFIGVETADELQSNGHEVTIVEIMPRILGLAFDEEFAAAALEKLTARGVAVKTGMAIREILGDGKVAGVKLDGGETMEADAVILALGYAPNSDLAKKMGLEVNELGFVKADQYKRTSKKDHFVIGDCSEKRDFLTGKLSRIMLASAACAEARVAGLNLYSLSTVSTFRGTIGIYSTCVGDTAYGVAGLNEVSARNEGFDIVTGSFTGIDTHPGCMAYSQKQTVKLIVSKCGAILGGETMGGRSVGELTNVIGFAIQNKMTVNDLLVAQIGTHPMLTASPAGYPLIKAAEVVAKELRKK
ncbi:FAD-dependent oxidoreductase [Papillibacter cinnamivorans]|uniref:Pyruvate/2-oxoglutarate dehydrogenase complex, dihydrolipoamide dehydrogenase (E3) component n=1 Tax=Papillibacter cinnamivorans DSM 12816 TaxID=1122930 RepID=A0A1W2CNT2_9FIRM|nr:FAD-dependent oxidoreductase [Papillibacter cinnamivorans]SMC86873.1 Pyruvate/2-oxoglutarate dehydrogenase complex, dihydrolipoamide dehydrogenase (E3) component [Papillibacter cinnamivorans DSM 12816]